MPGKNKVIAVVDDEAKAFLVHYQTENKFRTRDDSVESILHEFPKQEERINELEERVRELEAELKGLKK
jgi:polyhydroxyalkanoate synthesis regulator phasin